MIIHIVEVVLCGGYKQASDFSTYLHTIVCIVEDITYSLALEYSSMLTGGTKEGVARLLLRRLLLGRSTSCGWGGTIWWTGTAVISMPSQV
jgi:hypothetical protein